MGVVSRLKNSISLLSEQDTGGLVYSGKTKSERTSSSLERIDKDKLEKIYIHDPVVFNSINLITKTFLSTGYDIVVENSKVKADLELLKKNVNFTDLLLEIIEQISIYGNAWIELVKNKKGNKIVDLVPIDPKSMDFQREHGDIEYDEQGNPVGYVQETKMGEKTEFDYDDIAHFKLYTVGDGPRGVGLIEPIYKTSYLKLNIEEGLGNAIYRHGFPLFVAKVGDENHPPSPDQIQDLGEKLKDISSETEIVIPHYYDLEIVESKKSEKLQEHLDYYIDQQVTGLGTPKSLVTGSGEGMNRATLDKQMRMFERTFNMVQRVISRDFEEKVFGRMADFQDWKEIPTITWNDLNVENLDSQAERWSKYVKQGLLEIDKDVKEEVRRSEGLPVKKAGLND